MARKGSVLILVLMTKVCVNADSEVKESKDVYSCCEKYPSIQLDPQREHLLSANNQPFAHYEGETLFCHSPCKSLTDTGLLTLDKCGEFKDNSFNNTGEFIVEESRIYSGEPCHRNGVPENTCSCVLLLLSLMIAFLVLK